MEAEKNPPQIVDTEGIYPEQPWSQIHVDFAGPINGLSFFGSSQCPFQMTGNFPNAEGR